MLKLIGLDAPVAYGAQVTKQPSTKDNWLQRGSPTQKNGTSTMLRWQRQLGSASTMAAILHFDFSGDIPAGSSINAATLSLYVYNDTATASVASYIYRLTTTDWAENNSDWNTKNDPTSWVGGGAFSSSDYTTTDAVSTYADGTDNVWINWTVTTQIQTALDSTSGNYHALISHGEGTTNYNELEARSKEYTTDTSLRPKLVIDYTPESIPPTGTITINSGATYANSTAVTLTLSATDTGGSGVAQMQFSNDGTTYSTWEAYATSKAWTLAAGDGTKTVYAKFKDAAGNEGTVNTELVGNETGLVGLWHLNGTVGSIANGANIPDSQTNVAANNGTASNVGTGMAYQASQLNQAINFDGTDDNVSVSALDLSATDKVTASFWFKPSSASTGDDMLLELSTNYNNYPDSFIVLFREDEKIDACAGGSYNCWVTSSTFTPNTWYYITATFDRSLASGESKVYVNGVLDGSTRLDANNTGNFGNRPFYIASRAGSSLFFNGLIDEVAIYNRALSAAEVTARYNSPDSIIYDGSSPTDPSGLSATAASTTQVNLSWSGSTDSGGSSLAGYKIERAPDVSGSPGTFSQIATSASPGYSDTSVSVNTKYWYKVRAYDNATNNSSYTSNASATTVANASTPAIASSKDTTSWHNSSSIAFSTNNAFDNNGLAYYRYAFSEVSTRLVLNTDSLWNSGDLTLPVISSGIYYLHIKAYNASNSASSQVTYGPYRFDIEKPTVAIISHTSGDYVKGKVYLKADASDNIEVVEVSFYNNSLNNRIGSSPNVEFDTRKLSGARTVYAKAVDRAGNSSVSSIILNIDNVKPKPKLLPSPSPKGGDNDQNNDGIEKVKKGSTVKLYYKVGDNFSKARVVVNVYRRVNKGDYSKRIEKTLEFRQRRQTLRALYGDLKVKKDKTSKRQARQVKRLIKGLNKKIKKYNPYRIKGIETRNLGEVDTNKKLVFTYKANKKGIFRIALYVYDQALNSPSQSLVKWVKVM